MKGPPLPEKKRLQLGVVSYLYHDDKPGGKLTPDRYQEMGNCDPNLYHKLQDLVNNRLRDVREFDRLGMLPDDTQIYHECVSNFTSRRKWLDHSLTKVEDSKLVFLNPDNGLASQTYIPDLDSPKHAYIEELRRFFKRGQSLLMYQHQSHTSEQIATVSRFLRLGLGLDGTGSTIVVLWFHRIQARFYFFVVQRHHQKAIGERLKSFMVDLETNWCTGKNPHFTFHNQYGKRICVPGDLP